MVVIFLIPMVRKSWQLAIKTNANGHYFIENNSVALIDQSGHLRNAAGLYLSDLNGTEILDQNGYVLNKNNPSEYSVNSDGYKKLKMAII